MVEFKLAIGDSKTKRTFKAELKSPDADQLIGKKIGDKFRGELIGLTGFEFEITGGSDNAGFPMRTDIEGVGRKKILHDGKLPGFNPDKKFQGQRKRKTVRANTIATDTVQINCKITKWGEADLLKHFGVVKEEKPKEEPKPEAPKEESKPKAQPETKEEKEVSAVPTSVGKPKEEPAPEKPVEEKKE